jgi:hypothetical protein
MDSNPLGMRPCAQIDDSRKAVGVERLRAWVPRPTYFLSGTLRPAIVSACHRRASSTAGTSLRAARSRTSRRTPTRFRRSLGLSASQSATYQLAH